MFSFYLQSSSSSQGQYAKKFQIFFLQNKFEPRHQIHLGRIIPQNLTNDSAKVNLIPVLQQVLLDENLKYLRVKEKLSIKIFLRFYLWTCNLKKAWSKSKLKLKSRLHCSDINADHCNPAHSLQYQWCRLKQLTQGVELNVLFSLGSLVKGDSPLRHVLFYTTGCPTKHDSWWIVFNVFFNILYWILNKFFSLFRW